MAHYIGKAGAAIVIDTARKWGVLLRLLMLPRPVCMESVPGLGKTFVCPEVAAAMDSGYVRHINHPGGMGDELKGGYMPDESGAFSPNPGPITVCTDYNGGEGACFLADEIDKSSDECLAIYQGFADRNGFSFGSEFIAWTDKTRFWAATNYSRDILPEALADRFTWVKIEPPNPNAILALPTDLQAAAQQTAALADSSRRISMREWYAFADYRESMGEHDAAAVVWPERATDIIRDWKLGNSKAAAENS